MRVFKDITYKNEDACELDLYLPVGDGFETIVWFHRGGLEGGDKQREEGFVSAIVDAGYGFIIIVTIAIGNLIFYERKRKIK